MRAPRSPRGHQALALLRLADQPMALVRGEEIVDQVDLWGAPSDSAIRAPQRPTDRQRGTERRRSSQPSSCVNDPRLL